MPDPSDVNTNRIEAFSDAVFAISITLLALEIRTPADTDHLARRLFELWPSYVAYVISFLLIGLSWANHHALFQYIRSADRMLMFLNTIALMITAFLPFATAVLATSLRTGHDEGTAELFYGATLFVGSVFYNVLWAWARHDHRLLEPSVLPQQARSVARGLFVGVVLAALGAGLGALVPVAGLIWFGGVLLLYWLPIVTLVRPKHELSRR